MVENTIMDNKAIIKIAGAFIAWVIGSGFATGQEVLQFISSYGYMSYALVLVSLIGFIVLGQVLITTGFENKEDESFNHFKYFCGERLGKFYSWMIQVVLILIMSVLVSGAGSTLNQYYGINGYIGLIFIARVVYKGIKDGYIYKRPDNS